MKTIVIMLGVVLTLAAGGLYLTDSSGKARLAQENRESGRRIEAISGQANPAMYQEAPILDPTPYLILGGVGVLLALGGAMMRRKGSGA
jgi:hypothetical protein